MKKIFFLLALFSIAVSAQSADSVDVRAMVQRQIDAARERDRLEQIKRDSLEHPKVYFGPEVPAFLEKTVYFGPEPEYFGPKEEVIELKTAALSDSIARAEMEKKNIAAAQKIINTPIAAKKKVEDSSNWKLLFLGGVALFAFAFVFIRRLIINHAGKAGKNLKNNIRILREEGIKIQEKSSLKSIRSKLINSPVILNNHGKPLAEVAKELNISQGEILLAAKIKSYELAKDKNEKWFLN